MRFPVGSFDLQNFTDNFQTEIMALLLSADFCHTEVRIKTTRFAAAFEERVVGFLLRSWLELETDH